MKISELRERARLRGSSETDALGAEVTCDDCGEWVPDRDDLAFWLEAPSDSLDGVVVCAWCLCDVEYDVIPPKCQGCGKERNMTRVNEVHPGVYFCWECLRTVWT